MSQPPPTQLGDRLPPPTPSIQANRPDDCINILLATDNHIGYNEKDPVRGRDSINTFEEILKLAVQHDVDMLLLAGDLFHENKPSRTSLYQTTALLRQYCMGQRPISIELISDAGVGLSTGFPQINYEDQNMNVGLPVFSIHGNHDDPQGVGHEGALCALDLLSASGLINYFGRQDLPGDTTNDEAAREKGIQVKPVLLQKGSTKLAMYGVGNMRDERFHYEMRQNRISLYKPAEDPEEWFNLLLIHQNRISRGAGKNSVPENGFGDDVDLIVWGHEHDCRITPEEVTGKRYWITQPGSSVATSLADGESITKHVALLKIQNREFQLTPLPLKTVRPFVMDEVVLSEEKELGAKLDNKTQVNKFLKERVAELIKQATAKWEELHVDDEEPMPTMLPLIRLRVEYSGGFEVGNPQRFGQDFLDKVANPRDIVQFYKKKKLARGGKVTIDQPDGVMEVDQDAELPDKIEKIKMSTLVHQYLSAQNLNVLAENGLQDAVTDFVEKDDRDAIKQFYEDALKGSRMDSIEMMNPSSRRDSDEEIDTAMTRAKEKAVKKYAEGHVKTKKKGKGKARAEPEDDDLSDFDKLSEIDEAPAKKGAKTAASKGKGKALFDDEEDEEEEDDEPPRKSATRGKSTASKKAPAKKATSSQKAKQSTLSFTPAPRGSSRAAAAKAKQSIVLEVDDDDDEDDDAGFIVESDEEEEARPSKKRAPAKKR